MHAGIQDYKQAVEHRAADLHSNFTRAAFGLNSSTSMDALQANLLDLEGRASMGQAELGEHSPLTESSTPVTKEGNTHRGSTPFSEALLKDSRKRTQALHQELVILEADASKQSCPEMSAKGVNIRTHRKHFIAEREQQPSGRVGVSEIEGRLQELQDFLKAARQGLKQTVKS